MYAAIMGRSLSGLRARMWRAAVLRSGMLTAIVLAVLLGGAYLFSEGTRERETASPGDGVEVETGGNTSTDYCSPWRAGCYFAAADANGSGNDAEFVSATLLPGRGMNVLQIMARIPSLGEVPPAGGPDAGRGFGSHDRDRG